MKHAIYALIFLLPAAAQTPQQTVTYEYTGQPLGVPSSNTGVGALAEVFVPAGLTVSSVSVRVQLTYPSVGDLVVYLYSANGTRTVLLNGDCGGLQNVDTTFDDAAPSKYSDFCPVEAGRGPFRGDEPLANSKGEFSAGYWQLYVRNTRSSQNSGLINTFAVTITGTPVTVPSFGIDTIANAASLDTGVVAPGELVSIFGVALGPQTGVAAGTGALPTSLAGTTVTFDGNPVPILYSSYYQVNVLTPYTLRAGQRTAVRVQSSGGTSGTINVDVFPAVAGLFAAQSNGRGQALAVNQDGTINSVTSPAPPGTYVSLYASGLGAVTPPVTAGTPAPSDTLSYVNGGVTVIVGGLNAPVQFVGLAPGTTGLYQINIQIPPTALSGPNRVFVISPTGYASQSRVFLQVQ